MLAAVMGGCTNNQEIFEQKEGRVPLSLRTYVAGQTRADVSLSDINSLGEGFQLTATYLDAARNQETMFNTLFYVNPDNGMCSDASSTQYYWPSQRDTTVTFVGLYPTSRINETLWFNTQSGSDRIIFSADDMSDYLYTYTRTSCNAATNGSVTLNFKHLQAYAVLQVKCDDATRNYQLTGASLTMPGQAYCDCTTGEIKVLMSDDVTYEIVMANDPVTEISDATAKRVGSLMAIAASGSGSACTLTLTFQHDTNSGTPRTYTRTAEVNLVAGYQNTITATISGDTPLSVSVSALENWHIDHDAVDLGLPSGLLWATCNVGADNPEDYGDYFAWGETTPHYSDGGSTSNPTWLDGYEAGYWWETYKYCNGSQTTLTKYCNDANSGADSFTDTLTILTADDDAASVIWGGEWRMPTAKEWDELIENCTWTPTSNYNGTGIAGQIVEGQKGNSIFLPAAGCRYYTYDVGIGSYAYYWSSSLYSTTSATYLHFDIEDTVNPVRDLRVRGHSVRAVRKP